jgi:hypothetical protein
MRTRKKPERVGGSEIDKRLIAGISGQIKQKEYVRFLTNFYGSDALADASIIQKNVELVGVVSPELAYRWPLLVDDGFMGKIFSGMKHEVFRSSGPATPGQTRNAWRLDEKNEMGDRGRLGHIRDITNGVFAKYVRIFRKFLQFFIKSHLPKAIELWCKLPPCDSIEVKYELFVYELVRVIIEGPMYTHEQYLRGTQTAIELEKVVSEHDALLTDVLATFMRYGNVNCDDSVPGDCIMTMPNPTIGQKVSNAVTHVVRVVLMSMEREKYFHGSTTGMLGRMRQARFFKELATWKVYMTTWSQRCEGTSITVTPQLVIGSGGESPAVMIREQLFKFDGFGAYHKRLLDSASDQLRGILTQLLGSSGWFSAYVSGVDRTVTKEEMAQRIVSCFQVPVSFDRLSNKSGRMLSDLIEKTISDNGLEGFIKECRESKQATYVKRYPTDNYVKNGSSRFVRTHTEETFDNILKLHDDMEQCFVRILTAGWMSTSFMVRPVDWKDLSDNSLLFDAASGKVMISLHSSKYGGDESAAGGKSGVLHNIDRGVSYMLCGWLRFFGAPSLMVMGDLSLDNSMTTALRDAGMEFKGTSLTLRELSIVLQDVIFKEEDKITGGRKSGQFSWASAGTSTNTNNTPHH